MTKKVNIYPSTPIVNVQPVIRSIVKNATKDLDTIRKCIISRAKVEEVLPNGELVRLDLNNYDKDNTFANVKETTPVAEPENIPETLVNEEKVEEPATEAPTEEVNAEPEKEVIPAVEEEKVVETTVEEPVVEEKKEEITEPAVEEVATEEVTADPENIPEAPVEEKVEETTETSSVDYINAELDNIELPEDNDVDDGIDNDEPGL